MKIRRAPLSRPVTLRKLARLYGVQTAYDDITGRRRTASTDALLAALRVLGAQVERPDDADGAWHARVGQLWRELTDPVLVAWQGHPATAHLRLAPGDARVEVELVPDGAEARRWTVDTRELPLLQSVQVDGLRLLRGLRLPQDLPTGYHELRLKAGRRRQRVMVICAPTRAHATRQDRSLWGVFAPIYGLRSGGDWGSGDYTHLEQLGQWVAELGGGIVATLPFCCSFLDTLFAPSPYSPASRLFWNELFVDPRRAPNLSRCPEARRLEQTLELQADQLRPAPLVDYRAAWALKRRLLEPLSACFFRGERHEELDAFLAQRPEVVDYARFRAATHRHGPWHRWPDPRRLPEDRDPREEQLHLYVQWLADQQIDALAREARRRGPGLYVDLPLGVHDCGYDTWRHPDLFPLQIDVGAPPDSLFTAGQKWGFPPLHPLQARQDRYRHVIDYLGHITRKAGILRVDHVMGLHRLFWIPKGMEVRHGVYVKYPAEELYAILSVESHRNRCLIVGENLGTVPSYVNRAMRRHRIFGMHVLQYVMGGEELPVVPELCVASLNTHDMPPFAGYWRGHDIDDRHDLGLIDADGGRTEHEARRTLRARVVAFLRRRGLLHGEEEADVLAACLRHLGLSRARMVLVNLEDLWLETQPQNTPGIGDDRRPIWRPRLRLTIEQAQARADVMELLGQLRRTRPADDRT